MAPLYTLHTTGDSVLSLSRSSTGVLLLERMVLARRGWQFGRSGGGVGPAVEAPISNRLPSCELLAAGGRYSRSCPSMSVGLPWGCWLVMRLQEERVRHRQGRCHWRRFLVGQCFETVSRKRRVPLDLHQHEWVKAGTCLRELLCGRRALRPHCDGILHAAFEGNPSARRSLSCSSRQQS